MHLLHGRPTNLSRIAKVDDAVISAARVSGEAQWGVPDHWRDPFGTLRSNREDYAIAKHAALLEAGASKGDLRIVILRNVLPNEHHAAVAVCVDGQLLILDNRT